MSLDVLISNARVVDGTGTPWFHADVGIDGDRIVAVGHLRDEPARLRIDADGLVLAPGFIDAHVHAETLLLREPVHLPGLRQGVTTHIGGQDGFGFAPADEATLAFMYDYLVAIYRDGPRVAPGGIGDYLARYDGASTVNLATLVPNGCVRSLVMGNDASEASPAQLETMADLCREGMREGAVGLSSGLDYVPTGHATTAELTALSAAVAPFGGVYVSHVRYRDGLLAALGEAIEIGRRSHAGVHISHLMGDANEGVWSDQILGLIDAARAEGVDVTFDVYPYTFGCTFLGITLPNWVMEGTRDEIAARLRDHSARTRMRDELGRSDAALPWSTIELAGELRAPYADLLGRDVASAAASRALDPLDLACDLLLAHDLDVLILGLSADPARAEDDLRRMLCHPAHILCSDGIYREGRIHPRGTGAIARFAGRFVAEGLMPLERAVQHATSFPARRFGLADRGRIAPGCAADLVVLDPDTFADHEETGASGVRDVIVNGVPALLDGEPTGSTPGRGLRRSSDASFIRRIANSPSQG
jgi:N-acyl-D-amino-acid deacylase